MSRRVSRASGVVGRDVQRQRHLAVDLVFLRGWLMFVDLLRRFFGFGYLLRYVANGRVIDRRRRFDSIFVNAGIIRMILSVVAFDECFSMTGVFLFRGAVVRRLGFRFQIVLLRRRKVLVAMESGV